MRIIALDVHRSFAQMAVLEKGVIRDAGKVDLERSRLLHFAKSLKPDDEIVLEATGNTSAIVRLLSPFVARVAIANPNLVRAIAWAKVKTDKIDARVLAKLHASGFLPEVWMPDEETEARRRVTAERTQLVSQMTRLKNRIHAVLHAHLIPPYPGSLFSQRGRPWLGALPLAEDQRRVILRHAGELDRLGAELAELDKGLAQKALADPQVRRLMTITGVNATGGHERPGRNYIHDIKVIFVDEPDESINRLGIKGLGEIGIVGVAAAVANAIYHATGTRARDLPITLDKLDRP
jgi:transposase